MMRGYSGPDIPRILEAVTKKVAAAGSPRPVAPPPSSSPASRSFSFQNETSMSTRDTSFVALPGMSIEGVPEHMVSKLAPAGKHGKEAFLVSCSFHALARSNDKKCVQMAVPLGMASS